MSASNDLERRVRLLETVHADLDRCRLCPNMIGPVVHGPPIVTKVLLVGQAPGPHEGGLQRPFAWTAGKTLFRWFEAAMGIDEAVFRQQIYMSAVARCFPGKAPGGGDRRPAPGEIAACGAFLTRETQILRPELVIPVGTLAIEQVLKRRAPLVDVIGRQSRTIYQGIETDVIALPHPSGASPWHKTEPGRTLLAEALQLIAHHPALREIPR
jgi:uracil-DNA glycosylase